MGLWAGTAGLATAGATDVVTEGVVAAAREGACVIAAARDEACAADPCEDAAGAARSR
jgi:hypothetical protein